MAAALASTLTKLAVRYLHHVTEPQSRNVSMVVWGMGVWQYECMGECGSGVVGIKTLVYGSSAALCPIPVQAFCGEVMLIVASIMHFGRSGIPKKVNNSMMSS